MMIFKKLFTKLNVYMVRYLKFVENFVMYRWFFSETLDIYSDVFPIFRLKILGSPTNIEVGVSGGMTEGIKNCLATLTY